MKKISGILLLSALFACLALPTQAQLHLALKGGLNIASVKFNKGLFERGNVTGFHIGPMVEMTTPGLGLGFDAAILYSQKGVENKTGDTYTTDNIDVPVNLKWKISPPMIGDLLRFFVAAGPYLSFRVGQDHDIFGAMKDQFSSKTFGAGANLNAGIELFSRIQLEFTYGMGLTDNWSYLDKNGNATASAKEKTMLLSAVLLF